MDCTDLLSVVVVAILNLGQPSSAAEILANAQAMCSNTITLAEIQAACDTCTARGICTSCTVTGDATIRYEIRGDMLQVRWDNEPYWKLVKQYNQDRGTDPVNPLLPWNTPQFGTNVVFFDDFNEGFDFSKWYVIKKAFGVNNGGMVPLNVNIKPDYLVLSGNGDLYTGPIVGVQKVGSSYPYTTRTTRVGGGVFTQKYFGSGTFEVRAKVMPYYGAYSAFWTFYYAEDGLDITNHEIDIELPGRPGDGQPASFDYMLGNTFQTETDVQTNYIHQRANTLFALNDGLFHTYKIDWFAGSSYRGNVLTAPRVKFYIDDILVGTNTQFVPYIAGRFWIGIWFPDVVAGTPNFVTGDMYVDWVRITSNPSPNDQYLPETYPNDGIAPMNELNHLR